MKKLSFILIILSFLFALSAIAIAIGGTISLKNQADTFASDVDQALVDLDAQAVSETEPVEPSGPAEPIFLTPEDLGFSFITPENWGAFTLSVSGPSPKGGFYSGKFDESPVFFMATDPTIPSARGAFYADLLGYRKTTFGYEANFLGNSWVEIPTRLVQGEVPTKNGFVLVVSADDKADGPSFFGGEKGTRIVLVNLQGDRLPGGIFMANKEVPRDEFRSFLESLTFTEPSPSL